MPRRQRKHADVPCYFSERTIDFFDERLDAFLEGRDVRGEQAGLDTVEKVMEGDQGVDFGKVSGG